MQGTENGLAVFSDIYQKGIYMRNRVKDKGISLIELI